jgi:hypothetical protein
VAKIICEPRLDTFLRINNIYAFIDKTDSRSCSANDADKLKNPDNRGQSQIIRMNILFISKEL